MKNLKEKICGIYKITSPTGRIYIGHSKDIRCRWLDYKKLRCEEQRRLYNSLIKHGVENHNFEIVERCEFENLNKRERYWQEEFNVTGKKGLNCVLVGYEDVKTEWSLEMKKSMSDRVKGEGNPMYGRDRKGLNKGRKASQETKKILSEIAKNRPAPSKESLEKRSISMIGKMSGSNNPMFGKSAMSLQVIQKSTGKEYKNIKICSAENGLNYTMLTQHLKGTRRFDTRYDDYKLK